MNKNSPDAKNNSNPKISSDKNIGPFSKRELESVITFALMITDYLLLSVILSNTLSYKILLFICLIFSTILFIYCSSNILKYYNIFDIENSEEVTNLLYICDNIISILGFTFIYLDFTDYTTEHNDSVLFGVIAIKIITVAVNWSLSYKK